MTLDTARMVREIDDYIARLTTARDALAGGAPPKRTPGKRGRPQGTGKRAEQAVAILREGRDGQRGLTVAQVAETMSIAPNYLYRVLPGLEQAGRARKEGRLWYAVEEGRVIR